MSHALPTDTRWTSAALALAVHGLFALLLLFGLSWQVREPEPLMVEMWSTLPPPESTAASAARSVPRRIEPAPRPEPVRPAPEPVRDADIALEKKRAEKQRHEQERLKLEQRLDLARREEAERERAEAAEKKRRLLRAMEDESADRLIESDSRAVDRLRQQAGAAEAARAAAARQAAAAGTVRDYTAQIGAKVRGNTRLPDNLAGNPEVRYRVSLLPTGEVREVRLLKSSGNPAYDQAVARAIEKSSPLPLPADRDARAAFVPELTLVHRPKD